MKQKYLSSESVKSHKYGPNQFLFRDSNEDLRSSESIINLPRPINNSSDSDASSEYRVPKRRATSHSHTVTWIKIVCCFFICIDLALAIFTAGYKAFQIKNPSSKVGTVLNSDDVYVYVQDLVTPATSTSSEKQKLLNTTRPKDPMRYPATTSKKASKKHTSKASKKISTTTFLSDPYLKECPRPESSPEAILEFIRNGTLIVTNFKPPIYTAFFAPITNSFQLAQNCKTCPLDKNLLIKIIFDCIFEKGKETRCLRICRPNLQAMKFTKECLSNENLKAKYNTNSFPDNLIENPESSLSFICPQRLSTLSSPVSNNISTSFSLTNIEETEIHNNFRTGINSNPTYTKICEKVPEILSSSVYKDNSLKDKQNECENLVP